jgi:hypothetical protein
MVVAFDNMNDLDTHNAYQGARNDTRTRLLSLLAKIGLNSPKVQVSYYTVPESGYYQIQSGNPKYSNTVSQIRKLWAGDIVTVNPVSHFSIYKIGSIGV